MPSWRWHISTKQQSDYAFTDYRKMLSNVDALQNGIRKYHITIFILPFANYATRATIPPWVLAIKQLDILLFGATSQNSLNLPKELKKLGFTPVYAGNVGIVYIK